MSPTKYFTEYRFKNNLIIAVKVTVDGSVLSPPFRSLDIRGYRASSDDDKVNAALISLRATDCVPVPLNSALPTFGTDRGQSFWDGYVEVNCNSTEIRIWNYLGDQDHVPSSWIGFVLLIGHSSHVFNGLPRMTLLTGSITDTFCYC